jgi:hypothetical protein
LNALAVVTFGILADFGNGNFKKTSSCMPLIRPARCALPPNFQPSL